MCLPVCEDYFHYLTEAIQVTKRAHPLAAHALNRSWIEVDCYELILQCRSWDI